MFELEIKGFGTKLKSLLVILELMNSTVSFSQIFQNESITAVGLQNTLMSTPVIVI